MAFPGGDRKSVDSDFNFLPFFLIISSSYDLTSGAFQQQFTTRDGFFFFFFGGFFFFGSA